MVLLAAAASAAALAAFDTRLTGVGLLHPALEQHPGTAGEGESDNGHDVSKHFFVKPCVLPSGGAEEAGEAHKGHRQDTGNNQIHRGASK